ncbi:MAG: MAPEG family protein [Pseudomonadota bacterium]|nr:MAPEG family protein [Erythrobacter sp.]
MHTTILASSAVLVLLTLALAFWTSIARTRSNVIAFDAPTEPTSAMAKAKRAHGNAAEYSGLLIGLFVVVGFVYQGRDLGAFVQWTIIAVTAARILQAIGILTCATLEKIHPLKVIGSMVTYLGGMILAIMVLLRLFWF